MLGPPGWFRLGDLRHCCGSPSNITLSATAPIAIAVAERELACSSRSGAEASVGAVSANTTLTSDEGEIAVGVLVLSHVSTRPTAQLPRALFVPRYPQREPYVCLACSSIMLRSSEFAGVTEGPYRRRAPGLHRRHGPYERR